MAKKPEYNDDYYNWVKGIGAYEKTNDPLKSDLFSYERSKSPQVVAKSPIDRSSVYSAPVQADRERVAKKGFDSEGDQYDYLTAEQAGIKPNNYNKHMGSVAPVTEEMFNKYKEYGLPKEDSYVILKGNKHPTHNYTVEAENERGSEIKKFGDRYFSVPKQEQLNTNNLRPDGTVKGSGFLGGIKRLDNPDDISSEISIGVDWGSGEKLIPQMVPTLDDNELKYLLSTPEKKLQAANPDLSKSITQKAVRFAREREAKGLPFFAQPDESPKEPRAISLGNKKDSFIEKLKERAGLK